MLQELTIIIGSNSSFEQVTPFSDGFDPSVNFSYPASLPSSSPYPGSLIDPLNDSSFPLFTTSSTNEHLGFLEPLSPYLVSPSQSAVHEELVMHYFSTVRKIQFFFAEELTHYTYSVSISAIPICFVFILNSLYHRPWSANPEGL